MLYHFIDLVETVLLLCSADSARVVLAATCISDLMYVILF